MPATSTPSNSEDDEDDHEGPSGPGIHGELLRHQDLGDLKNHEIEFHDGKKVKVTPTERNKALSHIKSMMGPGKNPDARMTALRKLGSNHETFKKTIGEEVDLDESGGINRAMKQLKYRQKESGGSVNQPVVHAANKAYYKHKDSKTRAATQEDTVVTDSEKRKQRIAAEDVEQVDEKLIGKQKNLDKNRNGKLDKQDFEMLRKESVEPKVSVYTEANRFRSVENAVKDIMQNNTNLRQLAKEEEFKRNNPGHFED